MTLLEGVPINRHGQRLSRRSANTDADGKWAVGVPEKNAEYTVTLDEDTLPEGHRRSSSERAIEPNVKER